VKNELCFLAFLVFLSIDLREHNSVDVQTLLLGF
jgi:hypothetical protein